MDKAIILLKPDCIQLGLQDELFNRLFDQNLKLVVLHKVLFTEEAIREFYYKYENHWFFPYIIDYLREDYCIFSVWEGDEIHEKCAEIKGNSYKRTGIRGEWASSEIYSEKGEKSYIKNVLHVSDPEDFEREYEILSEIIIKPPNESTL
jgi:nucleoside diphosphate kinase